MACWAFWAGDLGEDLVVIGILYDIFGWCVCDIMGGNI